MVHVIREKNPVIVKLNHSEKAHEVSVETRFTISMGHDYFLSK